MSGIIGHSMYAILGGMAAENRKLPVSSILQRHSASYLSGAYLGCDVQTMPEAVCVDTGEEVGYGTAPLKKSPLTGGKLRPWFLRFEDKQYRPREIHRLFYGRAHLVFGWAASERNESVPWDHLADYCGAVVEDAIELYGPSERRLAYLFGWIAHIVGDSLIKSVQPGVDLSLLDGKYTPRNRPIQDLVTYHEIGVREFGLNWPALLADLAAAPVEPIQLHYMRANAPQGLLAQQFPNAWAPQLARLLTAVLDENRRYQAIRNTRLVKLYQLRKRGPQAWDCSTELSKQTGGLTYAEMVKLAERAGFRHALWQIGESVGRMFEQVIERTPTLTALPVSKLPQWTSLGVKWKRNPP